MTEDRVNEIRSRLEKATPGPWSRRAAEEADEPDNWLIQAGDPAIEASIGDVWDGEHEAAPNADLIANAPADLAYLLDRLEAAERERNVREMWHGTALTQWHAAEARLELATGLLHYFVDKLTVPDHLAVPQLVTARAFLTEGTDSDAGGES